MNVYRDLCTPILEELVENRAFDLNIPADSCDLSNILEYEEEEDRNITNNNNVVKRLTSLDGCKSYAQILAVVALVAELKSEKRTVSLRDVYYALKSLFHNQRECNDCILQVGRLLSLRRYEMNIIPASKGLVSGPVRFRFHTPRSTAASDSDEQDSMEAMGTDREEAHSRHAHTHHIATTASSWSYAYEEKAATPSTLTENVTAGCMLIGAQWSSTPAELIEVEWCLSGAAPRWLLVVEKEGVFRRLLEDQFPIKMNCILVTGCGYPDIATRALVSKLSKIFPTIEVVGVCDYNPHGIALLLTYRFPSASAAYESSGLQAPLRWLGLRSKHILDFCSLSAAMSSNNNTTTTTGSNPTLTNTGAVGNSSSNIITSTSSFTREHLQKLALSDTRKLTTMISALDQDRHADLPAEYRDELQAMLQGGVKCEIESSYSLGLGLLPGLLRRALLQKDYL